MFLRQYVVSADTMMKHESIILPFGSGYGGWCSITRTNKNKQVLEAVQRTGIWHLPCPSFCWQCCRPSNCQYMLVNNSGCTEKCHLGTLNDWQSYPSWSDLDYEYSKTTKMESITNHTCTIYQRIKCISGLCSLSFPGSGTQHIIIVCCTLNSVLN